MTLRRGLLLLALALIVSAALAPGASARPLCAFGATLSSAHFTVHFAPDDPCEPGEDYFESDAGDTLSYAEAAYASYKALGYPDPVDDGDGKVDLYVYGVKDSDNNPIAFRLGSDPMASPVGTTSGFLELNPADSRKAYIVAASAFHPMSLAITGVFQEWFAFGAGEWLGLRATGFPAQSSSLDSPEISLDCYWTPCAAELFEYNGQARWPFFHYLADRFGNDVVREAWERVAARGSSSPDGVGALQDVLVTKGQTLTSVFNDFAAALAAGTLTAPTLKGAAPKTVGTALAGGVAVGDTATTTVAVNHLAARFVAVAPGSGAAGVCHPATLRVDIALPAGLGARPSLYAKAYGGLKPFTTSGTTATLTTPWDTCTHADGRKAVIALPNPSTTGNGGEFTVTTKLVAVDTSTILSPDAPVEVPEVRPTTPTAGAVPPPTLTFSGSSTVLVAKDGRLTLAFFASNAGSLQVRAGGKVVKTVKVRTGQNVVRLRLALPKAKQGTRRAFAARPTRLDLVAVSPSGQVGRTFARKLRYAA